MANAVNHRVYYTYDGHSAQRTQTQRHAMCSMRDRRSFSTQKHLRKSLCGLGQNASIRVNSMEYMPICRRRHRHDLRHRIRQAPHLRAGKSKVRPSLDAMASPYRAISIFARELDGFRFAHLQHSDFTQCHFAHCRIVFGFQELFDRHILAGFAMSATHHDAVRSFANHRNHVVFFHRCATGSHENRRRLQVRCLLY